MLQNPYAPPTAVPGHSARIDPQHAAEIQARIKRLNAVSLAFGVPGLGLQFLSPMMIGGETGRIVSGLGAVLIIVGLSFYARMKGRSGWWGLLGFLSILGFIGLAVLPGRCHGCPRVPTKGNKHCPSCGAPVGVH